ILNVEMIDENYHEANIEAISFVNETGNYVIHTEDALNSQIFIEWLEDESEEKSIFDVKATTVALLNHNIHLIGVNFDLLIVDYVIVFTIRNKYFSFIARYFGFLYVSFDVYLNY